MGQVNLDTCCTDRAGKPRDMLYADRAGKPRSFFKFLSFIYFPIYRLLLSVSRSIVIDSNHGDPRVFAFLKCVCNLKRSCFQRLTRVLSGRCSSMWTDIQFPVSRSALVPLMQRREAMSSCIYFGVHQPKCGFLTPFLVFVIMCIKNK